MTLAEARLAGLRALRLAGFAVALASSLVEAATIRQFDVEHDHGCYRLTSITHLDAAPDSVFAVLTDYDELERISDLYEESHFLTLEGSDTRLAYTRLKGCVLFFCRTIRRVERIETEAQRFIRATVLPAQSDLDYGRSEWFLEAEKGGTRLTYRMAMHPSFVVPPVLGPWLLKRSLLKDGAAAVDRIEELANALPAPQ